MHMCQPTILYYSLTQLLTQGPSCRSLDMPGSSHFRPLHMLTGLFPLAYFRILVRSHQYWVVLPAHHTPFSSYFDILLFSLALTRRYILAYTYIKNRYMCVCVCVWTWHIGSAQWPFKEWSHGIYCWASWMSTDVKALTLSKCYFSSFTHSFAYRDFLSKA